MKISFLIVIILFVSLFFSCKKRPISNSESSNQSVKDFLVKDIDFKYLNAKAKLSFKDKENDFNAGVNIRIKKDSIIWISLTPALGIEASRCLITKDSVFVIDRINNQYYQYDFASLSMKTNINLNYSILESVFIGNLPFPKSPNDSLVKLTNKNYYLLTQKPEELKVENFVNTTTLKLEQLKITEKKGRKELQIVYTNFQPLDTFLFAYNNFVSLTFPKDSGIQSTSILLEFNKVEIPEKSLNFPFNVPNKFTRKQ